MAPASNEEQFKFLISCIRYSNNGKVNFGQVASECKIVSKGAAAKRYERMMRAHGIAPNTPTTKSSVSRNTTKIERQGSKGEASRKRKAEQFSEDNSTADDEEGYANIKSDPIDTKEMFHVKEEDGQLSLSEAANLMQFYDAQTYPISKLEEQDFGCSDFDASSMGYHNTIAYGSQTQQPYDFSSLYSSPEMNNFAGSASTLSYHNPYQYISDCQGGSDSPLIVE